MAQAREQWLALLPGKDCGDCGFRTCAGFAEHLLSHPEALKRCVHLGSAVEGRFQLPPAVALKAQDISWRDMLGRDYDLVLEQFPEDPGPREVILPFNPANVERLGIRQGDVLIGRPSGAACPVTHVGQVMEAPDVFNGLITWCVVGPLRGRAGGIEIGSYTPIAYEGIVRHARAELQIGRRYYFLPATCMLQSRHSGLLNVLARRPEGMRVRLEGIWIG